MDYQLFVTPGLGDNSYLLHSDGKGVLVDPQRDAWRFIEAANEQGLEIEYILETHVHNDYVSGAREVVAATSAQIVAPAGGSYEFDHRPVSEGDGLSVGSLRIAAMETPGHTPEHTAYVVYSNGDEGPAGVFTGGSLIVGSAGRTDLLGEEHVDQLTRAQFESLRRIAGMRDDVRVLPTHGSGSFCTSSGSQMARQSTVGHERHNNRAFMAGNLQAFRSIVLVDLMAYPAYYPRMAPINRAGPPILGGLPEPKSLTVDKVKVLLGRGSDSPWVIDGRDRLAFAVGHIPGSLNIELDDAFGTYVGWLVPFNSPIVLVLSDDRGEAWREAITQLLRIGFENVVGYLAGGMEAWQGAGNDTGSYPTARLSDLCAAFDNGSIPQILDVRQDVERRSLRIPGSQHIHVGALPEHIDHVIPGDPVWVICESGHRSTIAASLLQRAGYKPRPVVAGGVSAWAARGYAIER